MRALLLEAITEADIRTWPNPDPGTLPAAKREGYLKRRAALTAVVGGMSIRAAAKAYGVGRDALAESAEKALQPGADGRLLGFRACVPYAHRKQPRDEGAPAPPPAKKGPGALTRLISATDGLATLVEGYAGPLPNVSASVGALTAYTAASRKRSKQLMGPRDIPSTCPIRAAGHYETTSSAFANSVKPQRVRRPRTSRRLHGD